jgi:hypothetical protein
MGSSVPSVIGARSKASTKLVLPRNPLAGLSFQRLGRLLMTGSVELMLIVIGDLLLVDHLRLFGVSSQGRRRDSRRANQDVK